MAMLLRGFGALLLEQVHGKASLSERRRAYLQIGADLLAGRSLTEWIDCRPASMTVPGYADTRRPTRIFVDADVFDGEHEGSRTYLAKPLPGLSKVTTDVEVTLAARNIAQLEDRFAAVEAFGSRR